jgi:hypothetical protein
MAQRAATSAESVTHMEGEHRFELLLQLDQIPRIDLRGIELVHPRNLRQERNATIILKNICGKYRMKARIHA